MRTPTKSDRADALATLHKWITPGDTVYTVLRHTSRSGMQRVIGVVTIKDGTVLHPNFGTASITGMRMHPKLDGVVVGGCGMNMGFHLIYCLSYRMFPDGFGCIGDGCPSNDHSNGDRDYTPGTPHHHRDGGYALRQRWL